MPINLTRTCVAYLYCVTCLFTLQGEKICFIMDESNVLDTSFLERLNTLLANGEVPGLFEGDELTEEWSPKTESSRRAVPLHPLVVRALERVQPVQRPDGSVSPWVFPVTDRRKRRRTVDRHGRRQSVIGDRRSPTTSFIGIKLREALDKAGIKRRVCVHGLRRTFAVLLQETGAPDAVIRQALGHSARGVTETHYLPRRAETVRRWVDAIQVSIPTLDISAPDGHHPPTQQASSDASLVGPEGHCHQAATNLVAKRPPYLRLVE